MVAAYISFENFCSRLSRIKLDTTPYTIRSFVCSTIDSFLKYVRKSCFRMDAASVATTSRRSFFSERGSKNAIYKRSFVDCKRSRSACSMQAEPDRYIYSFQRSCQSEKNILTHFFEHKKCTPRFRGTLPLPLHEKKIRYNFSSIHFFIMYADDTPHPHRHPRTHSRRLRARISCGYSASADSLTV